jgi:hypothetical protein
MRNLILVVALFLSSIGYAQPVKIEGPGPSWEWYQTDKLRGNVVVITVVSRYTEKESYQVSWKLGTRLRDGDFKMITVIDFIGIPRFGFIYNIARKRILKETTVANRELVDKGLSPVKYICDMKEDNEDADKIRHAGRQTLREQLAADPRHRVDIIVLGRDGEIAGHFNGIKQIDEAIKLIDELTGR